MNGGPDFSPGNLAAWTGGCWTAAPAVPLRGFHFDSRQLGAGGVFVALRTARRDGHAFLGAARQAGAAAALVAAADATAGLPQLVVPDPLAAWHAIAREHRRAFPGPVVGISGSAGKTSTKDLLALLLGGAAGGVVATEGNLNNHLGVPLTLTRLDPARHRVAVIEAGINAPGEMAPLAAMIAPDLALLTLVAAAHTEALGGLDGVAREKAVLPAAGRAGGLAIFPRPVAEFRAFRELAVPRLVVERVDGEGDPAPAGVVRFAVAAEGAATRLTLWGDGRAAARFTLQRVTDGMAQNAVLALTAARRLGVEDAALQERLAQWRPAAMRGEWIEAAGRLIYLDCYNANPASMSDALAGFVATAPAERPRLFVLGCMEELGPEAPRHHAELGRALPLREGDRVFVIGGHAEAVAAAVRARGGVGPQVVVIDSLAPAAAAVAAWTGAIFIKGSRRYALEGVLPAGAGREPHA
jgi:UDP-N-acetylmuramoyl-tripeptide--D-alanyl-D-alanine ligase